MIGIAPVYGQRTSFSVPAKIVGIEFKKPWWNFFKKIPVYTIEIETSHLSKNFLNYRGEPINPPKSFLFYDEKEVLSAKNIRDNLQVSLDYADEKQQFSQRVHPFHFTIEGDRAVHL